jgi:peptidoglycan/LPS O-acetylase OafA/YrhL
MSTEPPPRQQEIPSLNGIRAISVLIVALSHSGFGNIVPGGLGVTIFFFLSGYLITALMLDEFERNGALDVSRFYARRIFRLVPPLLVTLAIAYGLNYSGLLPGAITLDGLSAQLLYFANYYAIYFDAERTIPTGTGVLWSLAVEEHFYIIYPFVMALALSSAWRARTIGMGLAAACIVVLAWRIYLVHAGEPEVRTYYATDTRIDSIIYGCILAVCMDPVRDLKRSAAMSASQWGLFAGAFALMLSTLAYRDPAFRETYRYSLQGLALLPIFYFAIRFHDNGLFRYLNLKSIQRLGVYSYAIYLIHYVVMNAIAARLDPDSKAVFAIFPIAIVLSFGYAAFIDTFVDPYFRRLRQKLRPKAKSFKPNVEKSVAMPR